MEGYLGAGYLWIKAVHIIFVIFWVAGLFMLPRFFAYHVEAEKGSNEDHLWQLREKRLIRIIMNPAMIITWAFGLMLLFNIGSQAGGWLHAKLLLVSLLSVFHMILAKNRRLLAGDLPRKSSQYYRILNEIPSIFVILIIILVIVRPF